VPDYIIRTSYPCSRDTQLRMYVRDLCGSSKGAAKLHPALTMATPPQQLRRHSLPPRLCTMCGSLFMLILDSAVSLSCDGNAVLIYVQCAAYTGECRASHGQCLHHDGSRCNHQVSETAREKGHPCYRYTPSTDFSMPVRAQGRPAHVARRS